MTSEQTGRAPRLYVEATLGEGAEIACSREQANYLVNVLRLEEGSAVRLFNGRDGEWSAGLGRVRKGACALVVWRRIADQTIPGDLHYLFAPLKRARLDYMVQKAVEMGACVLQPVLTHRTAVSRINLDRMRANAVEAAEQCGILTIPEIREPGKLKALMEGWPRERRLIYCDESALIASPLAALSTLKPGPLAVLIGPEGGFDAGEREMLRGKPFVTPLSLGPRIMRADTAAVAALSVVQAVLGDWRE